jgi:hypothetical protein
VRREAQAPQPDLLGWSTCSTTLPSKLLAPLSRRIGFRHGSRSSLACLWLRRASNRLPALARNNNTGKGRDLLGLYRARGSSPIGTRKLDWHGHFVGFAAEQICAPQDHNQSSRENARKGLKPLRASAGRHARVHPCTIRRHARGRVAFCPAEGAEMRGPTLAGRSDHFRATASRRTLSAEGLYVLSPAASSSTHASSTSPSPSSSASVSPYPRPCRRRHADGLVVAAHPCT